MEREGGVKKFQIFVYVLNVECERPIVQFIQYANKSKLKSWEQRFEPVE